MMSGEQTNAYVCLHSSCIVEPCYVIHFTAHVSYTGGLCGESHHENCQG